MTIRHFEHVELLYQYLSFHVIVLMLSLILLDKDAEKIFVFVVAVVHILF